MSAQHTPGPWKIFDGIEEGQTFGIDGADGSAVVYFGTTDNEGIPNLSNARLIAAAPELLEVLQDVLSRIETSDEWWMDCPKRGGFDAVAIRAAITKATGEQA